jgi:hypothetical protein
VAEFGAARQSSALAVSAGAATLLLDTRSVAISAIAPIPDMIPSSDTGRELSLLTSIAMRRKSGAGALDCVRIAIRELMEKVAMLRCVKKRDPGAARLLDWVLPPKTVAAISRAFFCNQSS